MLGGTMMMPYPSSHPESTGWGIVAQNYAHATTRLLQAPPVNDAVAIMENPEYPPRKRSGLGGHVNTDNLFSDNQVLAMQVTCCTLAGVSLILGLVICYWLLRMKKVFRHRLIFLLMIADMLRSTWFFVFPLVSLVRGGVSSESAFCQASGYFTNASFDMADWVVLFLAINAAVQVFKPNTLGTGQGGLYPFRYWVYALVVIVPFALSALAFINRSGAFLSQGPTCSLPIRPFWYRLALSWIPRYVIILVVVGLYIAIYVHAENQFCEDRPLHRRISAAIFVYPKPRSWDLRKWLRSRTEKPKQMSKAAAGKSHAPRISKTAQGEMTRGEMRLNSNATAVESIVTSDGRNTPSILPLRTDEESRIDSTATETTLIPSQARAEWSRDRHATGQGVMPPEIDTRLAWREMSKKHRVIRKQLRLQFVYPIIYFVSWLAPFANHVTMYDERIARRPIFPLVFISFASLALMGLVDFVVFSVRERPWRHIPGCDGTLIGSFVFWRQAERRAIVSTLDTTSATSSGQRHMESSLGSEASETRRSSLPSMRRAAEAVPSGHANTAKLETVYSADGESAGAVHGGNKDMQGWASWDFGLRGDGDGA